LPEFPSGQYGGVLRCRLHHERDRDSERQAPSGRSRKRADDAAMKLLYLVLNNAAEEWKRPPREWLEAKTQFAVVFGERFVSQ
jgi:transposase-like protein